MTNIAILSNLFDRFLKVAKTSKRLTLITHHDAISYYINNSMTYINFKKFIESTALSQYELNCPTSDLRNQLEQGHISQTTLTNNIKSYYITIKGLGFLIKENDPNSDLLELLSFIDQYKLPRQEFKLKKEEVLLILFLIVCNATCNSKYLTVNNDPHQRSKTYERLKNLEESLYSLYPKILGTRINFSSGKNVSWTRFITNVDKLPKTGIYVKNREDIIYYLTLDNDRSINFLSELCFSSLSTEEKLSLKNFITQSNIRSKVSMGKQVPSTNIEQSLLQKLLS